MSNGTSPCLPVCVASPAPPPSSPAPDDKGIDLPFTTVEFWEDYLDTAVRVTVNLFIAVVLGLIFGIVVWLVGKIIRKCVHLQARRRKKKLDDHVVQLLDLGVIVVKGLMWLQMIPMLVETVGVAVDSMVAIISALTVGVGLSLRGLAENFVMGVVLAVMRPFEPGDLIVACGKHKGFVQRIFVMYTVVREPNGALVHLPNSKVALGPMANLSKLGRARLDVGRFELSHAANLERAREALLEACRGLAKVFQEPPPQMIVVDISQTAVSVAARIWCAAGDQLTIAFAVREAVYKRFGDAGVPLASWQPAVAGALEQLEELGYPGLPSGRVPSQPAGQAGLPGDSQAAADEEMEGAAAAAYAVASGMHL